METAQVYKQLYEVMKSRRGPYTGLEIPEFYAMVEELFTPQEAEVNNLMPRKPATLAEIAGEMNRDETEIRAILEYQFISGKVTDRDRRIAGLIKAYKNAFNAAKGDVKMSFPVTRVIPVDRTIEAGNTVHTYDQVSTYIEKNETIGVGACYCRQAAKLVGEDTHDMPMEVCMWFGSMAEYAIERLGARKMTPTERAWFT